MESAGETVILQKGKGEGMKWNFGLGQSGTMRAPCAIKSARVDLNAVVRIRCGTNGEVVPAKLMPLAAEWDFDSNLSPVICPVGE
jgi:hypothetical protein